MKQVPVTPDTYAIVDNRFYVRLRTMGSWQLAGRGYVSCYVRGSGAKHPKRIYMHHAVMQLAGIPWNQQIDHRNRNKLDNRLRNLRPATNRQNNTSCGPKCSNTSGYKGVHEVQRKTARRWQVEIRHTNGREHLGCFSTPEEAARCYDQAAKKYHGAFAFLNFPTNGDVT